MFFLRFFFLPCQDVFQGVKLPVLSIAREGGLFCQFALGKETYAVPFAIVKESQWACYALVTFELNWLFGILKQFSCLLNVEEASLTQKNVRRSWYGYRFGRRIFGISQSQEQISTCCSIRCDLLNYQKSLVKFGGLFVKKPSRIL